MSILLIELNKKELCLVSLSHRKIHNSTIDAAIQVSLFDECKF